MRFLLWILIMTIGFSSCKPEEGLNVNYGKSADFVIPTSVFIAIPTTLDTIHFEHGIDSVLSANDKSFSDVKRVELTSMEIRANDTTGAHIGFLSNIDVTIGIGDGAGLLIATSGDLEATDSTSFVMQSTTRDLSEYFASESFWLIPEVVADLTVSQATMASVEMEFLVKTE